MADTREKCTIEPPRHQHSSMTSQYQNRCNVIFALPLKGARNFSQLKLIQKGSTSGDKFGDHDIMFDVEKLKNPCKTY